MIEYIHELERRITALEDKVFPNRHLGQYPKQPVVQLPAVLQEQTKGRPPYPEPWD